MPPCGLRYGRGFQRNSSKDAIVWVHFTDADVCSLPGLHSERADVHIQQWPEQKLGQRWNAPELHDLVNEIKDGLCRDGRVADVSDHTSHLCSLQVTQHT